MSASKASTTVEELLRSHYQQKKVDPIDIKAILAWAANLSRTQLITEANRPLSEPHLRKFKQGLARRLNGEPLAYITNQKDFYSRGFYINNSVLIPRPETEELVDHAIKLLKQQANPSSAFKILDVGCGSGVIAITLALEHPNAHITAIDCSTEALKVAQKNAEKLAAKQIEFKHIDFFSCIGQSALSNFDLIVSNPPYIASNDSHLSQKELQHEPQIALTDFSDGYRFYRHLASQALNWLAKPGYLLVEHGYNQQTSIVNLFEKAGFTHVTGLSDLSSNSRMVLAQNTANKPISLLDDNPQSPRN